MTTSFEKIITFTKNLNHCYEQNKSFYPVEVDPQVDNILELFLPQKRTDYRLCNKHPKGIRKMDDVCA